MFSSAKSSFDLHLHIFIFNPNDFSLFIHPKVFVPRCHLARVNHFQLPVTRFFGFTVTSEVLSELQPEKYCFVAKKSASIGAFGHLMKGT